MTVAGVRCADLRTIGWGDGFWSGLQGAIHRLMITEAPRSGWRPGHWSEYAWLDRTSGN